MSSTIATNPQNHTQECNKRKGISTRISLFEVHTSIKTVFRQNTTQSAFQRSTQLRSGTAKRNATILANSSSATEIWWPTRLTQTGQKPLHHFTVFLLLLFFFFFVFYSALQKKLHNSTPAQFCSSTLQPLRSAAQSCSTFNKVQFFRLTQHKLDCK